MIPGKVSIIMPAYNAGKYIAESIDSVMAQTYNNWELIIIDDESVDNTASIVKKYLITEKRISYLWQKNGKQGKARNEGIKKTDGEYIAFIDADDIWLPEKLSKQIVQLNQNCVDLVFGYSFELSYGQKTSVTRGRGKGLYAADSAINFLVFHDAFLMSTVLVKRSAILAAKGFEEDERIQYCEDWHLWLKLALRGLSFYSDASIVGYYRLHEYSAAHVEKEAKIKLFYALFLLLQTFPDCEALRNETYRRAYQLVYHSPTLSKSLIKDIVKLTKQGFLFECIYSLNTSIFRKAFLLLNKKPIQHEHSNSI
jgi:glycosyltransferase involved in cell wall biosynthesis